MAMLVVVGCLEVEGYQCVKVLFLQSFDHIRVQSLKWRHFH